MTNNWQEASAWWGNFTIDVEENLRWRIGPLTFIVRRLRNELQVAFEQSDHVADEDFTWEISATDQGPETLENNVRYVFRETTELLTIKPCLVDRPIISRPLTPFNLIGGEETTLFVSTPLWVELCVGNPPKTLTEFAIQRPSDTWFGPSTREGELCYASNTHCRLNLEDLPKRSHRAITPLVIRNLAKSSLLIERLKLATPQLPLYVSSDKQLWTPKVTLIRKQDGEVADIKIDKTPPEEANETVQLNEARKTQSDGALNRVFNAVFR